MTTPHEPTEACHVRHCYGCGLDHEGKAWLWCFECGHAWTPRTLRRSFRRQVWEITADRLPYMPWLISNTFYVSVARQIWRMFTIRAGKINFCPLCSHDF